MRVGEFEEMTPEARKKKRRHYQEMITKHLDNNPDSHWVSVYHSALVTLNKVDRRKRRGKVEK